MNLLQLISFVLANQKAIIEFINLLLSIMDMFQDREEAAQANVATLTAEDGLFASQNFPSLTAQIELNGGRFTDFIQLLLDNIDDIEKLIVLIKQLLDMFSFDDEE